MNAKTFAELALKIWGVFSILGALLTLPAALWMQWSDPGSDPRAELLRASQIGYVLNAIVHLAAGIVVLVWADRIVALFEADETPLHVGLSRQEVAVLAFAIVGVFVLVDGVQNLAGAGYSLWIKPAEVDTVSYLWARQGEDLIEAAVQIAAGAFLVLGREVLVRGWSRLRGGVTLREKRSCDSRRSGLPLSRRRSAFRQKVRTFVTAATATYRSRTLPDRLEPLTNCWSGFTASPRSNSKETCSG